MTPSEGCPFVPRGKAATSFVGRSEEVQLIVRQMSQDTPTSINVVGDRQMGKSSLLAYVASSYENFLDHGNRVVALYLSLQGANCRNQASFYQTLARELLALPKVAVRDELALSLRVSPFDGSAFELAMREWKVAGVLLVVCLDDFKELLDQRDRFDDGFYDNLRSLIGDHSVMFVIASDDELNAYTKKKQLTSDFFNVFQSTKLKNFSVGDANDLVRLPRGNPVLGPEKQKLALKWGEGKPCLLQMAGHWLWEARSQDRDVKWAKAKFDHDAKAVKRDRHPVKLLVRQVSRVGGLAQWIGDTIDDRGNFMKGSFIMISIVLAVTGVVKWEAIQNLIRGTQQDTNSNFK